MKKKFVPIFFSILVLAILLFLFFPRTAENAIVGEINNNITSFIIDGKVKSFKTDMQFERLSVVSFKYNIFKAYDFKSINALKDRVLIKKNNQYDLEFSGYTKLSKHITYYTVDENSSLTLCKEGNVILGKKNNKIYLDSDGNVRSVLVYPMDYSSMRVGISATNFSSLVHNKIDILATEASELFSCQEPFRYAITANTNISIENKSGKLFLTMGKDTYLLKDRLYLKGNSMVVKSILKGNKPEFNPSYNGVLEINISDDGLSLINETTIDDYLQKVVPSEMPLWGGIEALKCQAVAARTYAISDMLANRFAGSGFYVDDSTQSQVYNNVPAQAISSDAVDATKGIILTYEGSPIDAKYYSSSAGTGVKYSEVWFRADGGSENKPYLTDESYLENYKTLPTDEATWLAFYKNTNLNAIDSTSPYFRWRVSYSNTGLTNCLNKTLAALYSKHHDFMTIKKSGKALTDLPALKTITNIKVSKRGNFGNVMEITFVFDDISISVRGDSNIRSALKCSKAYTGEDTAILKADGEPLYNNPFLLSSFFSIEKTDSGFTIYGGGYGHGVGMSQYGALQLSKSGHKYEDILNTFYKNVAFKKLY